MEFQWVGQCREHRDHNDVTEILLRVCGADGDKSPLSDQVFAITKGFCAVDCLPPKMERSGVGCFAR